MRFFTTVFFLLLYTFSFSQSDRQWNSANILHHLKKLNVMGTVLYVAAHPDDENTRLITWLSNEKLVETAYISLTRGDGGQNLIGPELGDELGVIRTHELLEARKIDGGYQYFSRALDFGFSKTPSETFTVWNKKKILGDLVWVIRRLQPDVIITRFNTEPGKTHGHHTASAVLAGEAFEIGLDTNEYYDQLKYVTPWKPVRVLWNTSSFFFTSEKEFKKDTFIQVDVGTYNPLLGTSYSEIAALSRSRHKSQGFGSLGVRGESIEYFTTTLGPKPVNNDLLSGVDLTWNRVKNGRKIGDKIASLIAGYRMEDPAASVSGLLEVYRMMDALVEKSPLVLRKMEECRELIRQCLGFYVEVYTDDYIYAAGDTIRMKVETINRSGKHLSYFSLKFPGQQKWLQQDFSYNRQVLDNTVQKWTSQDFLVKEDAEITNPAWWNTGSLEGDREHYIQALESDLYPYMEYVVEPSFDGQAAIKDFTWKGIMMQRVQDPVKGEIHRPVYIAPPVTANFSEPVYVLSGAGKKQVSLELQAFRQDVSGTIKLELPEGWTSEPASIPFRLESKREKLRVNFTLTATDSSRTGECRPLVEVSGNRYQVSFREIEYGHIPTLVLFPPAVAQVVNVPLKKGGGKIAYLPGAGDEVSESLRQVGYEVDVLDPDKVNAGNLSGYQAVVVGIRAYNTLENIGFIQQELLKYAEQGGNVIVQYITTAGMKTQDIGPGRMKIGRDRVTDEKASMVILKDHPVLHTPNEITEKDFTGWVQERGLYFASEWDSAYTAVFSCTDPGEKEKNGSLLVARYGKGYFVYTGLAFFRQLPAGVPGAYRLMVNLIEL